MDKLQGKDYSWVLLTASRKITDQPCELLCLDLCPSAANAEGIIYDGIDATGKIVQYLFNATKANLTFKPSKPVYCPNGLYIAHTDKITSTFVQYRILPHRE